MIKREDLKIGDTIKVEGLEVTMKERHDQEINGVKRYVLIGETKNGKRWSTDFIYIKEG